MADTHPDGSQQQAARLAGVALLVSWPLVVYANFAIQDRLVVAGDAAETARNLLALAGLLSSAWAALCAFLFILKPAFEKTVGLWSFDVPLGLFELVLAFWLLIRGLKAPATTKL